MMALIFPGLSAILGVAASLRVVLVPCGPAPAAGLNFIGEVLGQELRAEVVQGEEIPVPRSAYAPHRRQYLAEAFLPLLLPYGRAGGDSVLVLGVTEVDLYVPELNFVFGLAAPGAIISLARLNPEFYGLPPDPRLLQERSLKEAVHELGHLLGLGHCPHPSCVMFFSNQLSDTDRKGSGFCPTCRRGLGR
jgi:archaemetzincin